MSTQGPDSPHPDKKSGPRQRRAKTLPFLRGKSLNAARAQTVAAIYARELQAGVDAVSQLPEVNATRVVALYDRIQRGEYHPDQQVIADKMLQLELALEDFTSR